MISGHDAWLIAAQWGSYMNSSDPGACMYGFSGGLPQSIEHANECVEHINSHCMPIAIENQNDEGCENDIEQLEDLLEWLQSFSAEDYAVAA